MAASAKTEGETRDGPTIDVVASAAAPSQGGTSRDLSARALALKERAKAASELMRALSHEGRLAILCLLVEGERSVGEIERALGLRQPAVSQQLARLRAEGLVRVRRSGKLSLYSLARGDVAEIIATLYRIYCPEGSLGEGGTGVPPDA